MNQTEIEKTIKAGQIAKEVREHARSFIKKDMPLLEIAEKIENEIIKSGGKPAFPTNLSINEIAAHYTPSYNDETLAQGLLKVDLGVQVDGWIADTAFSIDLDNNEENKKLIKASEEALSNALKKMKTGVTLKEIGETIQKTIESYKANPIVNLSGHSMQEYDLHSGITVPNIDNNSDEEIEEGLFAIEPFATFGNGKIYDGKPSEIYIIIKRKAIRNPVAREIMNFIEEEYQTLPFCSRWLVKKFGTTALMALKQLEHEGIVHRYEQLIEISHKPVAQSEHTVLIQKDKATITTE
jgi:methionyl aminopeptidase